MHLTKAYEAKASCNQVVIDSATVHTCSRSGHLLQGKVVYPRISLNPRSRTAVSLHPMHPTSVYVSPASHLPPSTPSALIDTHHPHTSHPLPSPPIPSLCAPPDVSPGGRRASTEGSPGGRGQATFLNQQRYCQGLLSDQGPGLVRDRAGESRSAADQQQWSHSGRWMH